MDEAPHAELVEPLLGEAEVLEPPAHLLAGNGLVPVLRHGDPDRLDFVHRADNPTVVEHFTDGLAPAGALSPVVHELQDVPMHREVGARGVKCRADKPFGGRARADHVTLARRPPVADETTHPVVGGYSPPDAT